ncbi:MAG: phosphoribosylformylglycinamidine synthase subunit PurQ [Candidatus Nanoarchaeia archaeon]|nr:phosphoribosylformylglycinamidine synthase subunit PurQ [Candidatus Nanoarchaeia archaeon]
MAEPRVLVLAGHGINCEEETKFAFDRAGAKAELVHVNDLINKSKNLEDYQILAFPGGFSFGDDTGSGNALANKIKNHLWDEIKYFVEGDKLAIGICNGFQVMTSLGLLPALDRKYGNQQVALLPNENARYFTRWVDLKFEGKSPWTNGIEEMIIPIAHGEGKFYADQGILDKIENGKLVAARYVRGDICNHFSLDANPNGSLNDIAAIMDKTGKLIGMMPHPERAVDVAQLPHYTWIREKCKRERRDVPDFGQGLKIFENAVKYFEED